MLLKAFFKWRNCPFLARHCWFTALLSIIYAKLHFSLLAQVELDVPPQRGNKPERDVLGLIARTGSDGYFDVSSVNVPPWPLSGPCRNETSLNDILGAAAPAETAPVAWPPVIAKKRGPAELRMSHRHLAISSAESAAAWSAATVVAVVAEVAAAGASTEDADEDTGPSGPALLEIMVWLGDTKKLKN